MPLFGVSIVLINQLKLESCDLPMFEWIAAAWTFLKAIPKSNQLVQQWHDVQLGAQKEIIRARDAQLDARDERIVLAREAQTAQTREIERLQRDLTQIFVEKKRLEEVIPLMIKRAMNDATDFASKYHSAAGKIELAYRIRLVNQARPDLKGTLKAPLFFAGEVTRITVEEIKEGYQQLLELLPREGNELLLRFRADCERRIEWAESEEKRLAGVLRSWLPDEDKR